MFDVTIEAKRADRLLSGVAKQLPFATSLALNNTAKDVQRIERDHLFQAFTIRKPAFARRAIKIKPFSTKTSLSVTIAIDPPGGRADIFAKFERGGRKQPRGQHIAVPIAVRRTKKGSIGKTQRPKAFKFKAVRTKTGKVQFKGEKRTFLILSGRQPGIYQRTGRGSASSVRLLYAFKKSVPIDKRLEFIARATRAVAKRFGSNFRKAFRKAIATAR